MHAIVYNGETYPLSEWILPSRYAQKYEKSIKTVFSWMDRGYVPSVEVSELGVKLLRDQPYEIAQRGAKPKRLAEAT